VKPLDRFLQRWRARVASPWVPRGARLLDVGCADGVFLRHLGERVASAVGVDPDAQPARTGRFEVRRESFPGPQPFGDASFDCIAILAVLEHVPDPPALARECHRVLAPGGCVVITVPHPFVDRILDVLMALHLLDGMEAEAHHGFDPRSTVPVFESAGFRTRVERSFQLGLNRLFVFDRA
jgi:2-polyprenyl-3-methyl-5-hydroxy-6-metoxy-1,4-benzoquinol methylase